MKHWTNPVAGVTPVNGSLLRYTVCSRTTASEYNVDLSLHSENGECDCDAFLFRCLPRIRRGSPACENLRCWHIKRARQYLTAELVHRLIEQENQKCKRKP